MTLRSVVGLACVALLACSGGEPERAKVYDDTAERAALVEGRGFAYVGFVPVTELGIDGLVTILPRAFTVEDGVPGAVVEFTRRLQQGPITNPRAGFLSNGFVEGPDVSVGEPNISSTSRISELSTHYWFVGKTASAYLHATLSTEFGPMVYLAARTAGSGQQVIDVDRNVFPIAPHPDTHGMAYAYFRGDVVGVQQPVAGGAPSRAEFAESGRGRLALAIHDGEVRVATTETRAGGTFLAVYRRNGDALEPLGEVAIDGALAGARLRILHARETFVVMQGGEALSVYHLRSGALVPVTLPAGTKHTLAVDDAGALYVGFSDPAVEGRASVQKLSGGAFAPVGQPGFSRDPVTAHVFPQGSDLYVMFTSVKSATGAAIACSGPTCVPYRKPTVGAPESGVASCSYQGDTCREVKGTTPKGFGEFQTWCAAQQSPTHRGGACPREGAVGACRKTYDGVEELSWSYGTYGKTAAMVEAACKATGTEFVPPG